VAHPKKPQNTPLKVPLLFQAFLSLWS